MTYLELLRKISNMSAPQMRDTVTVYINGEYYAITDIFESLRDDILDKGHMFLATKYE